MQSAIRSRRSKLKVAQILEATIGGTKKHLLQITTHLDKSKYDLITICSTLRDPRFAGDIVSMKNLGARVEIVQMTRQISPLSDPRALWRILKILKREKPNIVHAHSSKAGVLGRLAARLAGVQRIFYTPHVFAFLQEVSPIKKIFYIALDRFASRLTDKIIAVSETERELALRKTICPPHKIVTIVNGLDLHEFDIDRFSPAEKSAKRREIGLSANDIVVGAVGRLTLQKGQRYLLEAIPKVARRLPHVKVILVGDGDLYDDFKDLISRLGILDNTAMLGERRDIVELYAVMDIFVLPSLWEGMPYALLEAMAMSRPVVVTNVCGMPNVVGPAGIVVATKNSDHLAEAIIKLTEAPELRDDLGHAGRRIVEQKYDLRNSMAELDKLYQS